MRRTYNDLCWFSVFATIVSLILTIIGTYEFKYISFFSSGYRTFQWCMVVTMMLWSVKVYSWKETKRNKLYSAVCILIAAGSIFFIVNNVS